MDAWTHGRMDAWTHGRDPGLGTQDEPL